MTRTTRSPMHVLCVLLAVGTAPACDGDEEAKKKQEQEYVDKIIEQVDAACACTSPPCVQEANTEIDRLREEAKSKLGDFPSSEAHGKMMPHFEKLGQCNVGNF